MMRSIARAGLCLAALAVGGLAVAGPAASAAPNSVTVTGLVFGDANANGLADPGEGVSGVKVEFTRQADEKTYAVTTDSAGKFSIAIPTGRYYIGGSGAGWSVIPEPESISGAVDLSLHAVKPLGRVLTAAMHFTQDTYAPGDTAHIVVTLTNTGSAPLRGIAPACDRVGDPDEITAGPSWGVLDPFGPGVTLLAHQTRTFGVTGKVTAAAQRAGQVVVACDFGYPGVETGYRPVAEDSAKVPGLSGAIDGQVQYFPHGHGGSAVGIANVRVVLVDPTTCPVVTRTATTNGDGFFRIGSAPAGASYRLYLYPPAGWKLKGKNPTNAFVFGNDTVHFGFEVEHGSATVPSAPTTCTSPTPPTGVPIASTGPDAGGTAAVGAAAVVLGLVLTLTGRRRRTH